MSDYSYIGVGKIHLREVGAALPLLEIGNCSALSFAVSEEVKELKDYTQAGGGTYNEVRRIQSVECTISAHDLDPDQLARVLYGNTSAIASSALTNQPIGVSYLGSYLVFPSVPQSTPAPVIRHTNGRTAATRANTAAVTVGQYLVPATANGLFYRVTTAGTTAAAPPTFGTTVGGTTSDGTATLTCMGSILLTPNTHYVQSAGGVTLLTTGVPTTPGEPLEADYTAAAQDVVQALTTSGKEYEMVFEGLNEARSGKAVIVSAYRVRLGAAQNISLIGEDYAVLEITGKMLKDTTKTGAGVSQYFRVNMVR